MKTAIVAALALALFGCRCGAQKPKVVEKPSPVAIVNLDSVHVITVGNHSYVPINLVYGKPSNKAEEILLLLAAFERRHPELEVTSWSIEKQQHAHVTDSWIFGLWIDHRPKR